MPLDFTTSVAVDKIDAKHEDWEALAETWTDLDFLCRGGHAIRKAATRFLQERPKELKDVYAARVKRFTYQNIIGTSLGWYGSAMFSEDPEVSVKQGGQPLKLDEKATGAGEFYGQFFQDVDRNGTMLVDFFRDVLLDAMLFRQSFVLVDQLPVEVEAATLGQQREAGVLDPYLVRYDPRSVINWQRDRFGALEWVVIKTANIEQRFADKPVKSLQWLVLDRSRFAVYRAISPDEAEPTTAELVATGPHALSEEGRLPIRELVFPESMWLGDRAYLPSVSHLNLENAFEWALFMANLPIPVVTGEFEGSKTLSETGLIQLAEGSDFKFTEPAGTSFEHSANRIAAVRQEIYRQLYLQSQSRDEQATAAAQSGVSKKADMMPARNVLNGMGSLLQTVMLRTLEDVAEVRDDSDITFEVTGLRHEEDTTGEELDSLEKAQAVDVDSATYDREVQKRIARAALPDADDEVKQAIEKEIDEGPTPEEREQAERERVRQDFGQRLKVEQAA